MCSTARSTTSWQRKKLEVDMAIFQTVQDFVAWKKAGVLLPFKPDGYDKIDPRFRDPDGAFTTTSIVLLTYAYNTKMVAPADVPKSALDFLKPQFAGKLVTAYPADDDATLYVFDTIVKKYGWDYMKNYMAQKPNFIQGHLAELRSVANGTNLLLSIRPVRQPARSRNLVSRSTSRFRSAMPCRLLS